MDKESDARERESEWQNSMYISVFEIVQEIAFYTSICECSISTMCAQQVMCCTFIKKKKKKKKKMYCIVQVLDLSRLGWLGYV